MTTNGSRNANRCWNLSPQERLERIARILVEAMDIYADSSVADCSVTPRGCENDHHNGVSGESHGSGDKDSDEADN